MSFSKHKRPRDATSKDVIFEDSQMPMVESDDFLLDELSQEFLEFDDSNIIGECTQSFLEATQFFQNLYYQVGSGFEINPGPSNAGSIFVGDNSSSENLGNAVILEERSRRRNAKYQAEEISYRVRIDFEKLVNDIRGQPVLNILNAVRTMFSSLVNSATSSLNPTDLIRFFINTESLERPISTELLPVSSATVEKILSAVEKVLQSKTEICLDEGLLIDVITVQRDVGAGGGKKITNFDLDSLEKRSILSIPSGDDELCCAKAILYALAHLENDVKAKNAYRDHRRPTLRNKAKTLHATVGVPEGPCTYAEIKKFEDFLNVQVVVISADNLNQITYKGSPKTRRINLWLSGNHYNVITGLPGFYGTSYYCEPCEKAYSNITDHLCPNACYICLRTSCEPGQPFRCLDCDRLCKSDECFAAHKTKTGKQRLSLCDKMYQCRDCSKVILRRNCPQEVHRCWTSKCPSCKAFVEMAEHRCFLNTKAAKDPSEDLIFFDFETDQSSVENIVNFAVAQYANGEEVIFKGYTACHDFCVWLFSPKHKKFTAVAHNMKGFDGQFLLAWLLRQGTAPGVIPNGSKVMAITHPSLHIRIIDSFNFLPMSLSKLPDCFGFSEIRKGFFPHLFNTPENQDYVGTFPEASFYSPETMTVTTLTFFF